MSKDGVQRSLVGRENRVVYVINNAAFFCSHRLPIAIAAKSLGYDVYLVHGRAGSPEMELPAISEIEASGIKRIQIPLDSASISPLGELRAVHALIRVLRELRPSIVHAASPKAVAYAGLAATLAKVPLLVLSISGLGYAFTSRMGSVSPRAILSKVAIKLFRFAVKSHPETIVVTQDSADEVVMARAYPRAKVRLIPGSGVDTSLYREISWEAKKNLVVLPSRLLSDKGVREFVIAARELRADFPSWRFVLAGSAAYDNPQSIPVGEVEQWVRQGEVEWLGYVKDTHNLLREAKVVCLPSYREGMPKVLLEAGAAKCAVVTTTDPGCQEAILPNISGLVVPVRDSVAICRALRFLLERPSVIKAYGEAGRLHVKERHSLDKIVNTFLEIYGRRHG